MSGRSPTRGRTSVESIICARWGVRLWSALPYAHKPGVAAFLNGWAADFAAQHADRLSSATFYPEPAATADVRGALEQGVDIFKIHVQVGDFDIADPLLAEAWALVEESGLPVVIRAGSGPVPNRHTGPGPVAELLRRHPRLTAVIAHAGAPEYAEFMGLAERFESVHLDTTMVFTPFFEGMAASPAICCRGCATSDSPARCCSAAISRTSPTRTPNSSPVWRGSISVWTGCAPSDGTARRGSSTSKPPVDRGRRST